jgi:integrase
MELTAAVDVRIWHRSWPRKRGRTYVVCYQVDGGPELRLNPVYAKSEVEQQKRELRDRLKKGQFLDLTAGQKLFEDFAREKLEEWAPPILSSGTYNRYRQVINDLLIPEFAGKELAEIKRSDCQKWLNKRLRQVARGTAEVDKAVLTKVMTTAVKEKYLDASPAVDLDLPKVDRRTEKVKAISAWSEDLVHDLVDALPQRYRALGELARDTGMRQGELFAVALENLDLRRRKLKVCLQIRYTDGMHFALPKRGKVRMLDLMDTSVKALTEHIETYGTTAITLPWDHSDGPHKTFHLLFTNTKGRAIRRDHFNESAWHRALRDCGITPAGKTTGIHQLRHHVASLLLTQGMSIAEVAEVLGDTVQEISETYAHAMPDFGKRLRSINASREARIAAAREESSTDW